MEKKQIFLWSLYDFANSIAIGVFTLYFSQWLVIDKGVADIWYNLTYLGSTLLLIFTAPVIGLIADKGGYKKRFLSVTTIFQFVFLLLTSILAVMFPGNRLVILGAGLAYLLANYFYQFTFTFYNAMLPDIAPPEKQGLVSGWGQFGNFTGYIFGLLVTLPLVAGSVYFFGNRGRAQTFLPSTILFLIFALPVLLFLKEKISVQKITTTLKSEYKHYWLELKELVARPGMGRFLLAFFFFNDAMLTVTNNFAIYVQQVFNVSDQIKSLLAVGVFALAALGALLGGFVGDRLGHKRSLIFILLAWIVVFPTMGLLKNFLAFAVFCVVLGLLYGATWAITRTIMVYLSPTDKLNHAFSYYNMFERFSTFVGPLAWGLITTLLIHSGAIRYRFAIGSMAVFVLIGLIIVRKIPASNTGI